MCGETLKGDSGMKAMDVHRQHVLYKKDALGQLAANSGVRDFEDDKNIAGDRGASWMDGRFLQGTFTATRTLNDPKPDVNCGGVGGLSGLRSLSDGVNVLFCDGSVHYINKKMPVEVWQAFGHARNGGESAPPIFERRQVRCRQPKRLLEELVFPCRLVWVMTRGGWKENQWRSDFVVGLKVEPLYNLP